VLGIQPTVAMEVLAEALVVLLLQVVRLLLLQVQFKDMLVEIILVTLE